MLSEAELTEAVAKVMNELGYPRNSEARASTVTAESWSPEDAIPDITEVEYHKISNVADPANGPEFLRIKSKTRARLGQGRTGPRYLTATQLRFWADSAAAMDAVFTDVSPELLEELDLFSVQTLCDSKDEYLTRPDLGTRMSAETIATLKGSCKANPDVQIYVSDGLSSTAVEANIADVLPAILQGLSVAKLDVGTPFFVKYGRVRSMDTITEALGSKVTVVLLGERPGLATAESMSAYLSFEGRVGMPESDRTCISNIHQGGTNPVEAGAHIADVIQAMLKQQASGLKLKM